MKVFLKILLWVAIIAVVIFVVMLLAVLISDELDSFSDLINYILRQYNNGSDNGFVKVVLPGFFA